MAFSLNQPYFFPQRQVKFSASASAQGDHGPTPMVQPPMPGQQGRQQHGLAPSLGPIGPPPMQQMQQPMAPQMLGWMEKNKRQDMATQNWVMEWNVHWIFVASDVKWEPWNSISTLNWMVATQTFFIFTPEPWGFMIQFDEHISQMGWFNHQPENNEQFGWQGVFFFLGGGWWENRWI